MNKKEKLDRGNEAWKKLFKVLVGLTNEEAICMLEMAKIDIMLNDSCIVLDGKSGGITYNVNTFDKMKKKKVIE